MVSLARTTLLREFKTFAPAIFAIAFSGLLVLIQLGLLLGMFDALTITLEASSAQFWLGYRNTPSVDMGRPIPERYRWIALSHPDILRAEPITMSYLDWRSPGGRRLTVYLFGVDASPEGLAYDRILSGDRRQALQRPLSVLVGNADLGRLHAAPGTRGEVNDREVYLAGTLDTPRGMGAATLYASLQNARRLDPLLQGAEGSAAFFLLRARPGAPLDRVEADLRHLGNRYGFSVWSSQDLAWRSMGYWLAESGAGTGVAFSSLLGLLVGAVITSQTLAGTILALLKEYATLRALGVSLKSLRRVVLEQSFWVWLAGLLLTVGGGLLAGAAARRWDVALDLHPLLFALTGILTLLIALFSGLRALKTLYQADPALLLR